jgi:dynein heavy chain
LQFDKKYVYQVRTHAFVDALALQERQVTELQHLGDINELPRYLQRARTLQTRLHAALADIEQFNAEETAFGWETSQYPLREEVINDITNFIVTCVITVAQK